ncbi:hypothetical protein [Halobacillus sp. KGW1]|uniref:hypothetical protein n=1 Tax=Halobacillus sp. KGW1 TaxID=1793726 RepID=UPI0007844F16|nr:hypothetical protein [Halobacillus sp. KGW1]
MFPFFLFLHIAAGFSALLLLWIPLFTKKGGKVHNRFGWLFVIAMTIVSVSAASLAIIRIFFQPDTSPERMAFSTFLLFISLLSATTAYYGIRVLRFKKKEAVHRHPLDLAASFSLLFGAVCCMTYGFAIGNGLISYFPIIGLFLGGSQLAYWLRPMRHKRSWIIEHLVGMLSCSISTITAFTVFGAPRLLNLDQGNFLLWLLPTMIFTPLIAYFTRKYTPMKKKTLDKAASL